MYYCDGFCGCGCGVLVLDVVWCVGDYGVGDFLCGLGIVFVYIGRLLMIKVCIFSDVW